MNDIINFLKQVNLYEEYSSLTSNDYKELLRCWEDTTSTKLLYLISELDDSEYLEVKKLLTYLLGNGYINLTVLEKSIEAGYCSVSNIDDFLKFIVKYLNNAYKYIYDTLMDLLNNGFTSTTSIMIQFDNEEPLPVKYYSENDLPYLPIDYTVDNEIQYYKKMYNIMTNDTEYTELRANASDFIINESEPDYKTAGPVALPLLMRNKYDKSSFSANIAIDSYIYSLYSKAYDDKSNNGLKEAMLILLNEIALKYLIKIGESTEDIDIFGIKYKIIDLLINIVMTSSIDLYQANIVLKEYITDRVNFIEIISSILKEKKSDLRFINHHNIIIKFLEELRYDVTDLKSIYDGNYENDKAYIDYIYDKLKETII